MVHQRKEKQRNGNRGLDMGSTLQILLYSPLLSISAQVPYPQHQPPDCNSIPSRYVLCILWHSLQVPHTVVGVHGCLLNEWVNSQSKDKVYALCQFPGVSCLSLVFGIFWKEGFFFLLPRWRTSQLSLTLPVGTPAAAAQVWYFSGHHLRTQRHWVLGLDPSSSQTPEGCPVPELGGAEPYRVQGGSLKNELVKLYYKGSSYCLQAIKNQYCLPRLGRQQLAALMHVLER